MFKVRKRGNPSTRRVPRGTFQMGGLGSLRSSGVGWLVGTGVESLWSVKTSYVCDWDVPVA